MSLMVKQHAPSDMPDAKVLLHDQFVKHVIDGTLHCKLNHFVHTQPTAISLEVRGEAIRWECEGLPGGVRDQSHSIPSFFGIQYVQSGPQVVANSSQVPELSEIR